MVCDRCKTVLKQELVKAGISIVSIELGELVVTDEDTVSKSVINEIAERNGFEIIEQKSSQVVEKVKFLLIQKIDKMDALQVIANALRLKTKSID